MKFDIKTLVAMLSVCMLAPITPSSYVPTWGINHVAAAQMEQAQDMDYLVLVNKTHKLPSNYEAIVPLVTVKNSFGREFQIERDTYAHFAQLREALLKQGIQIELDSVYRSVARQQEIVKEFTEKYGEDYVKQYVAVPGYSEHHTGLAVDICLVVDGKVIDDNDEMIAQKEIFAKIHPLLPDYGFILRYPQGQEGITGYSYEPWHFRYVGEGAAKDISRRGVTFEEYMTEIIPYPKGLDTTSSGASSAPKEINHEASLYFSENDFFNMTDTKTRTMLTHYPTYQQTTEYTCGPAAALTVLSYYGNRDYNEMGLAKTMKTSDTVGTNLLSMVNFFKGIGWKVKTGLNSAPFSTYEAFREFVQDSLREGTPIIVENVDWGGHWRVIIGYDTMSTESPLDDTLILMNPYDTCDHKQDGYVVENGEKFYSMWFDHSILPQKQRTQPWLIAQPGR